MLDKGLLTEKATLAVIGTHEESYTVATDVRIKALELVEHGKLSERGLVAILGVWTQRIENPGVGGSIPPSGTTFQNSINDLNFEH